VTLLILWIFRGIGTIGGASRSAVCSVSYLLNRLSSSTDIARDKFVNEPIE
jgi:hypothetical protein